MNIEHFALNVPDPASLARWYVEHLGMRIVRHLDEAPFTHFIADESGRTVIEIYQHTKALIPDYFAMDPLVLHIAFVADDVKATVQRLQQAGAALAGEITTTPAGDEMAFLHDPWGVVIQLVRRARPLLEPAKPPALG